VGEPLQKFFSGDYRALVQFPKAVLDGDPGVLHLAYFQIVFIFFDVVGADRCDHAQSYDQEFHFVVCTFTRTPQQDATLGTTHVFIDFNFEVPFIGAPIAHTCRGNCCSVIIPYINNKDFSDADTISYICKHLVIHQKLLFRKYQRPLAYVRT
jgi:hypothetical protein